MKTTPLVSAIVVNWNGARDLEICLPSLRAQSYTEMELIVVDNASADDSEEVTRRNGARWLPLPQNAGLAPALNRGAEAAAGEFLLFLNNDMRFHEGCIAALVTEIMEQDDIFAVDALQYDWESTRAVHQASYVEKGAAGRHPCHEVVPGLQLCQEARESACAAAMSSAANMLVRKSMFRALGGFDERLFFGCEDLDLCWRGWARGWRTVYTPRAVCWHRVGHSSKSSGAQSLAFRGVLMGRFTIAAKLLPMRYSLSTWLAFAGGLLLDLAGLRWRRVQDRMWSGREFLRQLPVLLKERKTLFAADRGPRAQLQYLMELRAPVNRRDLLAGSNPARATAGAIPHDRSR